VALKCAGVVVEEWSATRAKPKSSERKARSMMATQRVSSAQTA
jgi:hypothetical protein